MRIEKNKVDKSISLYFGSDEEEEYKLIFLKLQKLCNASIRKGEYDRIIRNLRELI